MNDKNSQVRNYLLDLLENGNWQPGDKFPGARQLAQELGVSFLITQQAVNGLVQDGVLVSVPRRGVYVRKLWKARRILNHFVPFSTKLPYQNDLAALMGSELPELRCCTKFHTGVFEIRPTLSVQCNRNSYLDLSPFFQDSDGLYFSRPFSGFRDEKGRLFGIPFLWSPRIMLCRMEVLKKYGIGKIPENWSFDDFVQMVSTLRQHISPEKICNYSDVMSFYMNMISGAGGAIIERHKNGKFEVKLDSSKTLQGIEALRKLRCALDVGQKAVALSLQDKDDMAFLIADRECVCTLKNKEQWQAFKLPLISRNSHKIFQSTELICVRRECTDLFLAEKFVKFMLGEKVQNMIADTRYGIPILRSAADRSLDMSDPTDRLFFEESQFTTTGNLDARELLSFAYGGIFEAVTGDEAPEKVLRSYADSMRLICSMRENQNFRRAVHLYERDAAAFNLEAIAYDM